MRTLPGTRDLYKSLRAVREDVTALYRDALERIGVVMLRNTVNGVIPKSRAADVIEQAGYLIQSMFSQGRRVFAADGVTPLSPFADRLNRRLAEVTRKAIEVQAADMEKRLPEDVKRWLLTARFPASEAVTIRNPLAFYDAPHTWVDPNGYVLSDRIWRAGVNTRLKLDQLLTAEINRGTSAEKLAKMLEDYLLPGKELKRTNMPYGRDASYHAMTLARTEITRAHGAATLAVGAANPYVDGMDWKLSMRHPKFDICDGLATIGMGGERLKDAYPLASVPRYPAHPQCLCALLPAVTERADDVIANLRERIAQREPAFLTPLVKAAFVELLLGRFLASLGTTTV